MKLKTELFAVLILFLNMAFAMAQDGISQDSPIEFYQKGLKSYQEKSFSQAQVEFRSAYEKDPSNPFVLYNWGLSEFQLGHNGMALAAWRKALFLDPNLTVAENAIEFLLKTTSLGNLSTPKNQWENFRSNVLLKVSISQLLFISVILLVSFGWIVIRFFGKRNFALTEEMPLPPVPWLGLVLFALFLFAQVTAGLKIYDHFIPRGTIVQATVDVKSAPTSESSTLFEIYEGSEVIMKRKSSEWIQIKYPGGLSGWVQSQSVFHTSGQEL